MIKLAMLAAVCAVGSMATGTAPVPDKPYYDLENAENLFRDFVSKHGKSYNRREYIERLEIFKNSLIKINRLNLEYSGTVFGVNHFADLRPEELEQYRGFKPSNNKGVEVDFDSSLELPSSYDWRDHGVVSNVKDQGSCGSCYIFSAIGNIEGQYAIKHKECLALSEQDVVDCLHCGGCKGGAMAAVMLEFVNRTKAHGPMLEKDYPYEGVKRGCRENTKKVSVHVTSGKVLKIPDEDTLQQKLVQLGPLAVALVATNTMQFYTSGIFENVVDCGPPEMANHGVTLVGYGEENGKKYWIIKNSWGDMWGEKGYLRLIRGVNACQMGTSYTASATVA